MNDSKEKISTKKPLRTAREVIEEEFMTIGDAFGKIWTREELEEHHRIGDLIDEKLVFGYTAEQINAEWEGKTPQEILAETDANAAAPEDKRERETAAPVA